MTTHVRALYDFSGEPNTSELSIGTDEVLILTRTDVGEGWWEGTNQRGQTGLFPEAYVEIYHPPAPAQAAVAAAASVLPSPSSVASSTPTSSQHPSPPSAAAPPPRYDPTADDWSNEGGPDGQDDWDDDWDDDNETYSEIGPGRQAAAAAAAAAGQSGRGQQHSQQQQQQHQQSRYANAVLPPTPHSSAEDALSMTSSAAPAPLKKSGIFAKSGDSYILGTTNVAVSESERVIVLPIGSDYMWKAPQSQYTVTVASPKKKTKFKGMKSFIEYNLTPSFTNIPVSRRYKHFDWLHERLMDKFCLIPIPPLPDKQISGRYEDEFIEHRRVQLQEFVDWVCRHPVVSVCEVWMHFLTCTDEKKWKIGKRTAEKDGLVGATYCAAIFPPEKQLLQSQVDPECERFVAFVTSMDSAVKVLFAMSSEQTRRFQLQWKKDFQRVGDSFSELAKALKRDESTAVVLSDGSGGNQPLSTSVGQAAAVFIQLGQRFGDQPKLDWIPFCDRLHIYRGILSVWPDALAVQRAGIQKRKECERLAGDQKMGNVQLQEVNRRTDIMTYGVLAEMTHFRQERDTHLKATMRSLIAAQVEFYQEVVRKLQEAQQFFE